MRKVGDKPATDDEIEEQKAELQSAGQQWMDGTLDFKALSKKVTDAGWSLLMTADPYKTKYITHEVMAKVYGKDEADRRFIEAFRAKYPERYGGIEAYREIGKLAEPEKFEQFLAAQPKSTNIEDRRGQTGNDAILQMLDPRNILQNIRLSGAYRERMRQSEGEEE